MRQQGKLSDWNDSRGFGFVQPNGGGERCFVHIRSFTAPDRRPLLGDVITYQVQRDAQGRNNAVEVRYSLQRNGKRGGEASGVRTAAGPDRLPRKALALACLAAVIAAPLFGLCPPWVPAVYLGLSGFTYLLYWHDKTAARRNRRRTPEQTLHMVALLGGWPGALFAQATLRHKNRKGSFQGMFWVTVAMNLAALWWVCTHLR